MSDRAPSPATADVSATQQEPPKLDADMEVQEVESIPLPSPTASVQVKEYESISLPSPTASVQAKEVKSSPSLLSPIGSVKTEESTPSFAPPLIRKMRSEAERRTFLENDPQAEQVEPWKVLCRCCKKWIKLSTHSTYSFSNWSCHKLRCGEHSLSNRSPRRAPSKPTSRVATAERRIVLLNDPQVRECSPRHILCGTCRTVVVLDGVVDYNLVPWSAHKEQCIPKTPAPITTHKRASRRAHVPFPTPSTSSTDSHVSLGGSRRSPMPTPTPVLMGSGSNTQLKETVESPPAAAAKAGVKRGREEETEEGDVAEDTRPRNRPRKETYEPSEEDAPNVFGWFLLPFQNLTRGFREGVLGFT